MKYSNKLLATAVNTLNDDEQRSQKNGCDVFESTGKFENLTNNIGR